VEENKMARHFSLEIASCREYQRLLEESQRALDIWNALRVEVSEACSVSKEDGDELLRLQANYARAYTSLWNHSHNCPRCQLITSIAAAN